MVHAGYQPAPSEHPLLAATTAPLGAVHDPNARGMNGVAGHAGVFASAPDMVRFCLALAYPTTATHVGITPILQSTCPASGLNPPDTPGIGWSLLNSATLTYPSGYLPFGDLLSLRSYGHTGFTGTSLVFDPEHDLTLLLLTNRVYYENVNDGRALLGLRHLFSNLVAAALV